MSETPERYEALAGLAGSLRDIAADAVAAKDARIAELEAQLRARDEQRCGTCELGALLQQACAIRWAAMECRVMKDTRHFGCVLWRAREVTP